MSLFRHLMEASQTSLNPMIEAGYAVFGKGSQSLRSFWGQSQNLRPYQNFSKHSFICYTFIQINKDKLRSGGRSTDSLIQNFKKHSLEERLKKLDKDKFCLKAVERSPPCTS